MSSVSKKGLLERIRRGRKARAILVDSNLAEGIAFQIRATRDAQELTQGELAQAAGMSQNNLSRLEDPGYGKHTISSLKRIAEALDVALVVRFVPFSQYIDWLSGTPRLDEGLRPEAMAVSSFESEEKNEQYTQSFKYYRVDYSTASPVKGTTPVINLEVVDVYPPQKNIAPEIVGVRGVTAAYGHYSSERAS